MTRPRLAFSKGHGTGNDFVVIENHDALPFPPTLIAALCDRRTGIGADGVLLVTPSEEFDPNPDTKWFMDYRNADGSIAQMCGNGARVFGRYLRDSGLESTDSFVIGTRGGPRPVWIEPDGNIRVGMGTGRTAHDEVTVAIDGQQLSATPWWIPNPHVVAFVPDVAAFPWPLPEPGVRSDLFPTGQNVELVSDLSADPNSLHVAMRVHERGVGETRSCGTGVCAASLAVRSRHDVSEPGITVVDVPGGRLRVEHHRDGGLDLIGPAVLVAYGHLDTDWMEAQS